MKLATTFFDHEQYLDGYYECVNQFVPLTFCVCFAFTGTNSRGMLHHVYDVKYDKNMSGPIRTLKCRSTN